MSPIDSRRLITITALRAILLAALLLLGRGEALAQGDGGSGVSMSVEAGFDGHFKDGHWTAVFVTASNDGPPVEGQLRVASGPNRAAAEQVVYQAAISLPTRSHKRVPLYVYVPGVTSTLNVSLVDDEGDVVAQASADSLERVAPDGLLYGVVTSEPAVWTSLEQVTGERSDAAAALLSVEDLPANGPAWSALDVLIFHEVDSGQLSGEQQEALRGWLGQGGQLLATGGPGWQATVAGLDDLLPVTPGGTRSVDDLPALRNLGGVPVRDDGPYLVTASDLRSGQLVLYEEALPLLAKRSWGRGAVYFLALDPALPPLLDWRGSEALWSDIASATPRQPLWAHGPRNGSSAASAVSMLPALALPSAVLLCLFLMVYVAIVGPGNYLILKRLGRRELAWFTIPATILAFALLAYVAGFRLRGSEVIFNQMSVAFGHVEGEQMSANSLLGIYSPRRATYDVRLPQSVLVRPFDRNYGALFSSGSQAAISHSSDTILEQVRVDVSGLETYVVSSYQPLPPISGRALLHLEGQEARLEISVQNNGQDALENAGVFYGSSFELLGTVDPGASASGDWRLTSSQAAATAGATSGRAVPITVNAPLFSAHYDQLLGTSNYFEDPEVRPRFQLLESMQLGPGPQATVPGGAVTLVGWMEQPLFDVALLDSRMPTEQMATTLYFLELPIENVIASGEDVTVPPALLSPRILADSGVYAPSASSFHLPPGWIELEYEPWPTFQDMAVNSLEISLRKGGAANPAPPELYLWNWDEETWSAVPQAVWGSMGIGDFQPFVGEQNRVRLRLENNSSNGLEISETYPVLSGDLGE